jgi:hypothetical protein
VLPDSSSFITAHQIPFPHNFSIVGAVGKNLKSRHWLLRGIPNDHHSIENPHAFQILIDPQISRPRWLRAILRHRLTCLNVGKPDGPIDLKPCVATGSPALVDNVRTRLKTAIDQLLARKLLRTTGGTLVVPLGEAVPIESRFASSLRRSIQTRDSHRMCVR